MPSARHRARTATPLQYGDPERTPFVRFDPVPIFPENDILRCAEQILAAHDGGGADPFPTFIKRGPLGGQYGILPESTWFALIASSFEYARRAEGALPTWSDYCWRALEIMVRKPPDQAWTTLRELLLGRLDELSGWTHSVRRQIAEHNQIFRGEDGHYYFRDRDGILLQVIGGNARPADEERLYFITDQLVRSYGFLRQFLELFSLFAIADDFSANPTSYHKFVKAMLPQLPHHGLHLRWEFLHFDYSRTFIWRPASNLCDPSWLAGDILGRITDTLSLDFWQKPRGPEASEEWLNDGRKFQYDFVLETDLRLGADESAYIVFEDRVFRWINGTPERKSVISMSVEGMDTSSEEGARLNRLLSAITWQEPVPLRVIFSVGGGRSPYPKTYAGRTMAGLRIEPFYLQCSLREQLSEDAWFALALFREGLNAGGGSYGYLCFWKILDLVFPRKTEKKLWLMNVATKRSSEQQRIAELLNSHADLEGYLREERLNALKHVGRARPGADRKSAPLNPDKPEDSLSMIKDVRLMEDFAREAIRHLLGKNETSATHGQRPK